MSTYVGQMKDVIVSFNNTVAGGAQQLDQAAENATQQIEEIRQEAETAARAWAKLDPTEIDRDDLRLISRPFFPSVSDIRDLLVKHQHNGTMINALSGYIHRSRLGGSVGYVPKLADKLKAYGEFANRAVETILQIAKAGKPADNAELELWAESETIGEHLTAVIYGIN